MMDDVATYNDTTWHEAEQQSKQQQAGDFMAFASIKASKGGGKDFEIVPAGVHFAVCNKVVDLGYQQGPNSQFGPKRKVWIGFEIPDFPVKWVDKKGDAHEGAATVSREFGLSISEKSHLRPFLESWRGRPFTAEEEESFEVTSILGKVCQLSIIHEKAKSGDRVYANITGAFQLSPEQKAGLVANPERGKTRDLLAYSTEAHDQKIYESLPEWIRKKIDNRVQEDTKVAEFSKEPNGKPDFDDEIPF